MVQNKLDTWTAPELWIHWLWTFTFAPFICQKFIGGQSTSFPTVLCTHVLFSRPATNVFFLGPSCYLVQEDSDFSAGAKPGKIHASAVSPSSLLQNPTHCNDLEKKEQAKRLLAVSPQSSN